MHKTNKKTTFTLREIIQAYIATAGPLKWLMPVPLVLYLFDGIMRATVPAVIGYVVDRVVEDPGRFVREQLGLFAAGLLGGTIIFYVNVVTLHYLARKIGYQVGVRFQIELYNHLQRLSADFYQRTHVGEITSRLTNDIDQGVTRLYVHLGEAFWALAVFVPSCVSLALLSREMLAIFLAAIAVFVAATRLFVPHARRMSRGVRDAAGKISARITEDISAHSLIRGDAQEERFHQVLVENTSNYLDRALRTSKVTYLYLDVVNTLISISGPLGILIVGSYFASRGAMTVGTLVAGYSYWVAAARPVAQILHNITELFVTFGSVDRILEFFGEKPLVRDRCRAPDLEIEQAAIAFRDVVFRYPVNDGDIVLRDFNMTVPAGKSLAIVGESGAGKSTIVALLLRFYDPISGAIHIGGHDIATVTQVSLRRAIGTVMQDTILLSGSIRDNVRFARPEASDEEIIEALHKAQAWDFVREFPAGLDTELGERGARLSGGQQKRISIARVFLKNPPIVIFDEATSSLDTITERNIQQTMDTLYEGRTSVVIAHRLSTIVNCDTIVLLEKGQISAQGTHRELLARSPRYEEMCRKQELGSGIA